jgi:hypothetical protein
MRKFPQSFCLPRRHVGHTNFGTWGLANSIRGINETPDKRLGHCWAVAAPLAVSNHPRAAPWRAAPAGGAWRGTRPRPGLSANPATLCARKRCAHLYTWRRLRPTVAAMAVMGTPSDRRRIIRARLSSPARMVVARCHASSVRRSTGVRVMVSEVVRPRAILRPCVLQVSMKTTESARRAPGTIGGKEESADSTGGRQTRGARRNPSAVLEVPACLAREVTGRDRTTGRVLSVARPWEPCEHSSVVAHRPRPSHPAWHPAPQVRPQRACAICGPFLPESHRLPPSPRLRRHKRPCSHGFDHGIGHSSCACARQQRLTLGGKERARGPTHAEEPQVGRRGERSHVTLSEPHNLALWNMIFTIRGLLILRPRSPRRPLSATQKTCIWGSQQHSCATPMPSTKNRACAATLVRKERGQIVLSVCTLRRGDTHARESLSPSNRGARRHRRHIAHVPSSGVMHHTP